MSDKKPSIDARADALCGYFVGECAAGWDHAMDQPAWDRSADAHARARTLVLADEGLDAIIEELGLFEGEHPLPLESRSMFIIEKIRELRAQRLLTLSVGGRVVRAEGSSGEIAEVTWERGADPPEWLARYAELAEDMGVGVLAEGSYTQTANQWLGDGSFTQPLVAEQAKLACERRDYLAALGAATVLAEMRPSLGGPLKVALLALAMRACKDDEPVGHPAGFNACTKVRSDGVVELTVSEGARIVEVLDDEQDFEGF